MGLRLRRRELGATVNLGLMRAGVTFRDDSKVVRYEFALREVGIEPVRIAPGGPASLDVVDGLLLTGGTDVNPSRYGQKRAPETEEPDDERDHLETKLLRAALAAGRPVLAICRGMQLFNVAQGGTLIQHLSSLDVHNQKMPSAERGKHGPAHAVFVAAHTRLAAIIGEGEHTVNSRHHQAVERPGQGLVVSAVSSDGIIEALERTGDSFAIAVQWHPEDRILSNAADRRLFEAFRVAMEKG
jgi:putative glutamine amidotransferase